MQRRILLPLDGSANAEAAIPRALLLAEETQAQLFLLRVVQPARVHRIRMTQAATLAKQLAEYLAGEYLLRLATEITAHHPLLVRVATRVGDPALQIVEFAQEQAIALIVMTVPPRRGFWQALQQRVPERVARQTRLPILLVRTDADSTRHPASFAAAPSPSAVYGEAERLPPW